MKTARQLAARKAARRVRYKRRGITYECTRFLVQLERKVTRIRKKMEAKYFDK